MPKSRPHSSLTRSGDTHQLTFIKAAALPQELNATSPALSGKNNIREFSARSPNQGDTRGSATNTTPRVSPLPKRESYGFSEQSSHTSAENLAVAPTEQTLRDLVSAAEPISTTGNSIEVLSLLKPSKEVL